MTISVSQQAQAAPTGNIGLASTTQCDDRTFINHEIPIWCQLILFKFLSPVIICHVPQFRDTVFQVSERAHTRSYSIFSPSRSRIALPNIPSTSHYGYSAVVYQPPTQNTSENLWSPSSHIETSPSSSIHSAH